MSSSRLVTPGNLKDRIAALQQRSTSPQPSQPPPAAPSKQSTSSTSPRGSLRDKIAKFEKKGGIPVPRGSFGLGAPPPAPGDAVARRRGELYGNRIPSVGSTTNGGVGVGIGHPKYPPTAPGTGGRASRAASISVSPAPAARLRTLSASGIDFDSETASPLASPVSAVDDAMDSAASSFALSPPPSRRSSNAVTEVTDGSTGIALPLPLNHGPLDVVKGMMMDEEKHKSPVIVVSPETVVEEAEVEVTAAEEPIPTATSNSEASEELPRDHSRTVAVTQDENVASDPAPSYMDLEVKPSEVPLDESERESSDPAQGVLPDSPEPSVNSPDAPTASDSHTNMEDDIASSLSSSMSDDAAENEVNSTVEPEATPNAINALYSVPSTPGADSTCDSLLLNSELPAVKVLPATPSPATTPLIGDVESNSPEEASNAPDSVNHEVIQATQKLPKVLELEEPEILASPNTPIADAMVSAIPSSLSQHFQSQEPSQSQRERRPARSVSSVSSTSRPGSSRSARAASHVPPPVLVQEYHEPSIAPQALPRSFSVVVHSRRAETASESVAPPPPRQPLTRIPSARMPSPQPDSQVVTMRARVPVKIEPMTPGSPDLFALAAQAALLEEQLSGDGERKQARPEPQPASLLTAMVEPTYPAPRSAPVELGNVSTPPPARSHPSCLPDPDGEVPPTPPPKSPFWRNTFHAASRSSASLRLPRHSSSSEKSSEDSVPVATPPSPSFDLAELQSLDGHGSARSSTSTSGLSPKSTRKKAISRSNTLVNKLLSRAGRSSATLALPDESAGDPNRPPSPIPAFTPLTLTPTLRDPELSPALSSRPASMISVASTGSIFSPSFDREIFNEFPTVPAMLPASALQLLPHPHEAQQRPPSSSSTRSRTMPSRSHGKRDPSIPRAWRNGDNAGINELPNLIFSSHNN